MMDMLYYSDVGDLMDAWAYTATAIALFFIGFFGFFLNLCVIALMCKDVELWTPMNIILFNLVCSDFSVSILGNPLTLASTLSHRWMFGRTMCMAYGFFMSLLGITSITTLTVLSYERYHLISFPFSSHTSSTKRALLAIIFIWMYSLALTVPPLVGWGAYVTEAADISCSVNWESKTFNATTYIIFLFVFGLIVPVFIITYSYINILVTMRRNAARLGRVNKAENRITIMIALMIVAFIVAWTPYSVFALIEQFGSPDIISPGMAVLPALIAKSSICYNPIIYVGMNTQYRAAFNRTICKKSTLKKTRELTTKQLTITSSRFSIDCTTFVDIRRKKQQIKLKAKEKGNQLSNQQTKQLLKKFHSHSLNEEKFKSDILTDGVESFLRIQEVENIEFELSVISSAGKALMMENKEFKTDIE